MTTRHDDMTTHHASNMPDNFDRLLGAIDGLPDVVQTKQATIQTVPPLGVGGSETWIIHTARQDGQDTIFLQHVAASGTTRLAIPAKVSDAIARQRDALTSKVRSKSAKRTAQARKDAGLLPGFMKGKVK